jgi:hypothetical protein
MYHHNTLATNLAKLPEFGIVLNLNFRLAGLKLFSLIFFFSFGAEGEVQNENFNPFSFDDQFFF